MTFRHIPPRVERGLDESFQPWRRPQPFGTRNPHGVIIRIGVPFVCLRVVTGDVPQVRQQARLGLLILGCPLRDWMNGNIGRLIAEILVG